MKHPVQSGFVLPLFNGLLAAVMALAAWGAWATPSTELSFWSWRVEDHAFYQQVARDYQAQTGDTVRFTAFNHDEYPAALAHALATGTGPDIVHARAYGGLSQLADAGHLMPLTPQQIPSLARMSDALLAGAIGRQPPHDSVIYGLPFASQSLGIFYNRTLLSARGIHTMPRTWGEFKDVMRQLKARGVTPLANGLKDGPVLEQMFGVVGPAIYGGTPFFRDVMAGRKRFTAPEFTQAIEEVVALREFMPPNAPDIAEHEARTLFALGRAAFFMSGTWNIDTIRDINPRIDMDFVPAPPLRPGDPALMSTFVDGNFAINARSPHKEAALRFLRYLASPAFGQRFSTELRQITAVPDVAPSDPLLAQIGRISAQQGTPYLMLVGFRYQNPNGSTLLREGLQRLMMGQGTPQALGRELHTRLSTWHTPFQK